MKKILCSLILMTCHLSLSQEPNESCEFSPAGYGIHYSIDKNGSLKNILTKNLVGSIKTKNSTTQEYVTEMNGVKSKDYIKIQKESDDIYKVFVGTSTPENKKDQLKYTQMNSVSEYESILSMKNDKCRLMSMTSKLINSDKKLLIYDLAFCSNLISQWNRTLNVKDNNSCVNSFAAMNNWFAEQNKKFERIGLTLIATDKLAPDLNTVMNRVDNCKRVNQKSDPSPAMNKEKLPEGWQSMEDYQKQNPKKLQNYEDVIQAEKENPTVFQRMIKKINSTQ